MNKNTYPGLALTACLSIASTHLLAEGAPASSATGALDSSGLQRQQEGYKEKRIIEPLEPSEMQRQQMEQNKAIITAPETKIREPLEPSGLQRQQQEQYKGTAN